MLRCGLRVSEVCALAWDAIDLAAETVRINHGKGRVFYTALGHRDEVWRDERFRTHLLGAIRWSLAR